EAEAQRLLGDAVFQSAGGDGPRAEAHHRTALALAQELGMEPLAAHCHLGLGRLARRGGDRAAADKHLATATQKFEAMRSTLSRLCGEWGRNLARGSRPTPRDAPPRLDCAGEACARTAVTPSRSAQE